MFNSSSLNVYFICGTQDVPEGKDIREILKQALEVGITLFQFREKGPTSLDGVEKEHLAIDLLKLCHDYQVPFIVNDDVDLAEKINADGIHVGQDDENVKSFVNASKIKSLGLALEMRKNIIIRIWNMLIILELDLCLQQSLKMMLTHQ